MRRSSRDRFVLKLLGAVLLVSGCSRLTAVDWTLIPIGSSAGTGSGATDAGGAGAGESSAGAPVSGGEGGEAGIGGEATAGEAGAGDVGGTVSTFGGSAGFGGKGGAGGVAGHGGVAGSGGNGGMSGGGGASGGAGTAGGGGGGPAPCTGTPSAIAPTDLVLFDGGPGQTGDRGGRVGLDNACKAALAKLTLPQTKTHAFISVSDNDSIQKLPGAYPDISDRVRIVGPTGIELAAAYRYLISGQLEQSLVCAKVVPMDVDTWLTGSSTNCQMINPPPNACGAFFGQDGSCNGWTLATDDPLIEGVYGSTRIVAPDPVSLLSWLSFLKTSCDAATDHIVCLAYTPSQP